MTLIAVLDQHRGHNSVYYYDTYYLNTPNYFAQKINLSYSYLLRLKRGWGALEIFPVCPAVDSLC